MQNPLIICGLIVLLLLTGSVHAASPDQKTNTTQGGQIDTTNTTPVNVYVIMPVTVILEKADEFHQHHYQDWGNGTFNKTDLKDENQMEPGFASGFSHQVGEKPSHAGNGTELGTSTGPGPYSPDTNGTGLKNITGMNGAHPPSVGNITPSTVKSNLTATK